MPIRLNTLLDPAAFPQQSDQDVEAFKRAYLYEGGELGRVIERMKAGFSVLLYLPGNCMRAADAVVREQVGSVSWQAFGVAGDQTRTYADAWNASASLVEAFLPLFSGRTKALPYAIAHNLDLLMDGHGGVDQSEPAKNALFRLTEGCRTGVVLGLSDLAAGDLPAALRRPFSEELRLDQIPLQRFRYLIPYGLGCALADDGDAMPEGAAHLLASRLRWTDPPRAIRIMKAVGPVNNIAEALREVTKRTRSVEFSDVVPDETDLPEPGDRLRGCEPAILTALEQEFIRPFQQWCKYTGDQPGLMLRRLQPGFVLYGPPGTGKTRLARWVAREIGMPVRQVAAADLKRADWGLTERLVRQLCRTAARAAPCMIVLDDADDLLPDRNALVGGLSGAERGIVNAFLSELEGFHGRLEGVLVALTTNRFEAIDSAAIARLPRHYRVPYPLTHEQIREVVLALGRSLGIQPNAWDENILTDLVKFFFRPLRPVTANVQDPEVRRQLDADLFSPREIAAALRMLLSGSELGIPPDQAALERMRGYYE